MFVHPPLYPLPSRQGALILDTLQLVGALRKSRLSGAPGWFIKPPGWLHDAVRWGVKNARWLDAFFVRMDDLFGYGKQVEADKFWGEWYPPFSLTNDYFPDIVDTQKEVSIIS